MSSMDSDLYYLLNCQVIYEVSSVAQGERSMNQFGWNLRQQQIRLRLFGLDMYYQILYFPMREDNVVSR
jgi:hypothetical protein